MAQPPVDRSSRPTPSSPTAGQVRGGEDGDVGSTTGLSLHSMPPVPDDRPATLGAPVENTLTNIDLAVQDIARHWVFGWRRLILFLILVIFVAVAYGMLVTP